MNDRNNKSRQPDADSCHGAVNTVGMVMRVCARIQAASISMLPK